MIDKHKKAWRNITSVILPNGGVKIQKSHRASLKMGSRSDPPFKIQLNIAEALLQRLNVEMEVFFSLPTLKEINMLEKEERAAMLKLRTEYSKAIAETQKLLTATQANATFLAKGVDAGIFEGAVYEAREEAEAAAEAAEKRRLLLSQAPDYLKSETTDAKFKEVMTATKETDS